MLTITDLTIRNDLDRAAMTSISGGWYLPSPWPTSYYGYTNAPQIDAGVHNLTQGQSLAVDQSGSLGGFNAVASHQTQNGISGQVSLF